MDDIKTYSYTTEVKFNFKKIADEDHLSENTPFQTCLYWARYEAWDRNNKERYVIDNVDEIAKDLFYYLRRNKKELTTVTPQIKIELGRALDKIDSYVQAETPQVEIWPFNHPATRVSADWRVKEAWKILRNIPFLKEKTMRQEVITLQTEIELGSAFDRLNDYIDKCHNGYYDPHAIQLAADEHVEEAWEILRNIPFLKEE